MHQQDRRWTLETPGRLGQTEQSLDRARDESTLAVEEEERDDPDQRRQGHRQSDQGTQDTPARKVGSLEDEGEGHPDERRQNDRGCRQPDAPPERAPFVRPARELPEVLQSPTAGDPERLEKRQQQRIADQPSQQNRHELRGQVAHQDVTKMRGRGVPRPRRTATSSPAEAASAGAMTSKRAPPRLSTVKKV